MASAADEGRRNNWTTATTTEDDNSESIICVYALTSAGELLRFSNREDTVQTLVFKLKRTTYTDLPKLPLLTTTSTKRKRTVQGLMGISTTSKLALQAFADDSVPNGELPLLRGAFAKAFVGRNLRRRIED